MIGMNFKKVDAAIDAQNDLQLSIDTNTLYQPFRRTTEHLVSEELAEKPMHTPQTPRISNINVQKNKK